MFHNIMLATHAMCGGIFDIRLTANLLGNLPVKNFLNRLEIDRVTVMGLWLCFLAHPVVMYKFSRFKKKFA